MTELSLSAFHIPGRRALLEKLIFDQLVSSLTACYGPRVTTVFVTAHFSIRIMTQLNKTHTYTLLTHEDPF